MPEIVNVDNFVRAETDRMAARIAHDAGGTNVWFHNRVPTPFDRQPVIRQNRDTLYSGAVIDVSEGARITIPDAGERYISVMVINQDHYVPHIFHSPGVHEITLDAAGTAFVVVAVRVLVNPNDPDDVAEANALQDAIHIEAAAATPFTHPEYEEESFGATRDHLLALSRGLPDFAHAFGKRGEVDDVRHLLGTASGWGGFPEAEAIYLNVEPGLAVGEYELTVGDVPVDAFWSITVYNADGFMVDNERHVASVNSVTAEPNDDGTVTVRFGGGDAPNTIPITEGWNYVVRLYRPRPEVLDGSWVFPSLSS